MRSTVVAALAGVALAAGGFAAGRLSADSGAGHDAGVREGHAAGVREGHVVGVREGHAAGVREGHAAGVREGHAVGVREGHAAGLQEGRALQATGAGAGARAAFAAGYAAGANDVFAGFDGGWALSQPYVITLARGRGAVTYRIDSRRLAR
jgi:flagellar biosynthesis/type III secretory pathway protein FliH